MAHVVKEVDDGATIEDVLSNLADDHGIDANDLVVMKNGIHVRQLDCGGDAAQGRLALRRGPLIYCLEETDHPVPLKSVSISGIDIFKPDYDPDLLNGLTVLRGEGIAPAVGEWSTSLYRPLGAINNQSVDIVAIPYFAWDNREPGAMTVCLPSA